MELVGRARDSGSRIQRPMELIDFSLYLWHKNQKFSLAMPSLTPFPSLCFIQSHRDRSSSASLPRRSYSPMNGQIDPLPKSTASKSLVSTLHICAELSWLVATKRKSKRAAGERRASVSSLQRRRLADKPKFGTQGQDQVLAGINACFAVSIRLRRDYASEHVSRVSDYSCLNGDRVLR